MMQAKNRKKALFNRGFHGSSGASRCQTSLMDRSELVQIATFENNGR
jgi:hypothetical protein